MIISPASKLKLDFFLEKTKKIPWIMATHAFGFFLIFLAIELILGLFLLYYYIFLPSTQQASITNPPQQFQEKTYQSVLDQWKARQDSLANDAKQSYINPF